MAQYIIFRKLVLDLFENSLKRNREDKYYDEKVIHNIIFPMKYTSDEIEIENENLWLIDERLAYHLYLASDLELKKFPLIESESKIRPDITIFNKKVTYTEGYETPFNSVVIIELKKPERKEYNDDSNPIGQIYEYIEEINAGTAMNKDGRQIITTNSTLFFVYIICDITNNIEKYAKRASLHKTPDNLGYIGYNDEYRANVEIISFDKMLKDAKKRNRILFDKLGIK